jgi:UDP-galactopyranose mutase
MVEYPIPHQPGKTIAYYPVPREENDKHYRRYRATAEVEFPNMLFAGRLADYQYYNMDQACARALSLADQCQLRPSVFVAE